MSVRLSVTLWYSIKTNVMICILIFSSDAEICIFHSDFFYCTEILNPLKAFRLFAVSIKERCFAVRLVGGPSIREGRLEFLYNGTWGTVCDNNFTHVGAQVVCNKLGFG